MPIRLLDTLVVDAAVYRPPQPSVTTWHRLESEPAALDLAPGLEARIADPLWMIGRQWQLGELKGEDAGTPIQATLKGMPSRLDVRGARAPTRASDALWEPVIEAEADPDAACRGIAAAAGADLLRWLAIEGAVAAAAGLAAAFPFTVPADQASPDDDEDRALFVLARDSAIDGNALRNALVMHLDALGNVQSLPATVVIPAGLDASVKRAIGSWLREWEGLFVTPEGPSRWLDRRLEYQFDLDTDAGPDARSIHIEEYADGRLDWWSMDFGAASTTPAQPHDGINAVRIPVPVRYAGMPADRYFELEDGSANFAATTGGPTSISAMLVLEYVLAASNDWFHLPLTLEYGHTFEVTSLKVLDTFGREALVQRAGKGASGWTMFELALQNQPGQSGSAFVLPAVVAQTIEGDPIEEVALFRDEMANLVWAKERLTPGLAAKGTARQNDQTILNQAIDTTGLTDASYLYRMQTPVPLNWYPMTAEQDPDEELGTVLFRRRDLRRTIAAGEGAEIDDGKPKGVLLQGKDGRFEIEEAEVPRAGLVLTRSFQMARTADGRRLLWLGRAKPVGRGEGSSGLRHDVLEPIPT